MATLRALSTPAIGRKKAYLALNFISPSTFFWHGKGILSQQHSCGWKGRGLILIAESMKIFLLQILGLQHQSCNALKA